MNPLSNIVKLAGIALIAGVLTGGTTPREAVSAADEGEDFEVLARGPIHEAFAQPGELDAKPSPIVAKQPPPPIEEAPPELKPEGNNVQWIGGYWAWDDEMSDFVWVSGFWRDIPPTRQWVPGYWGRLADGWQRVPGYWADSGKGEQEYLPQPPPTLEAGPSTPTPGEDYNWIPGIWVYQNRYLWRPGYWLRCHRGWAWTPARYCWTPSGYLYNSGYWDYPLDCRGLLFAPARFYRPVWTFNNYLWRPRYCVYRPFLFNSLFVRPGRGFYFGDYYAARYTGLGYTPWIDYRVGRGAVADPLYNYHRWQQRGDPNWERNLAGVYAARRNEPQALPRTLSQQLASKAEGSKTPLISLAGLGAAKLENAGVRLQPVPESQLKEARAAAQQVLGLGQQRQKNETQLATEKGAPKATDAPRTAKLDMPKLATAAIQAAQGIEKRLSGGSPSTPPGAVPLRGGETKPLTPGKGPDMKANDSVPTKPLDKIRNLIPPEIKAAIPPEIKSAIQGIKGPAVNPPANIVPPVQPANKPPDLKPPVNNRPPEAKSDPRPLPSVKPPESSPPAGVPRSLTPAPSPPPPIQSAVPRSLTPAPSQPPPSPPPVIRSAPPPSPPPVIRSSPPPSPPPVIRSSPPPAAPAIRSSPAPVIRSSPPPVARPAPAPAARPSPAPSIRPSASPGNSGGKGGGRR